MIEKTKAYISDGKVFPTLRDAQINEMCILLAGSMPQGSPPDDISGVLVDSADEVIDILTTKESSKPKARSIHGGKKSRKPPAVEKSPEEM